MIENYPKRLIEVDLPIKRISAHARREKNIRQGNISTLHIWWARRPLAACRAVICASLWFDPADELCPKEFREIVKMTMLEFAENNIGELSSVSYQNFNRIAKNPNELNDNLVLRGLLLDFIADFANWDNSTNKAFLETARFLTRTAHLCLTQDVGFLEAFAADSSVENLKSVIQNLPKPLVVDPFAGGGAIPLEALRVGADAFASDLNPVAVLLNKVVLEYIPRYGEKLVEEIKKWGDFVKAEAQKELSKFYPKDINGGIPINYIWARTIICEGPACGVEYPLMRSLWLAKKKNRPTALKIISNDGEKRIDFEIIENAKVSNISSGTVKKGNATCPVCGFTTAVNSVRKQLKKRKGGTKDARLICVVTKNQDRQGRSYRLPNDYDFEALKLAQMELHLKEKEDGSISFYPDEKIDIAEPRRIPLPIYGMSSWKDLFTERQLLATGTFCRIVKNLEITDKENTGIETPVKLILALSASKLSDRNSSLCRWIYQNESPGYTFARQALPMLWDFTESVPLESGGGWDGILEDTITMIETQQVQQGIGQVSQSSATSQLLPDDSVDFLFTDPPYYYSIPYANLADFFYVWLKRILNESFPSLFGTDLTIKTQEIIQNLPHKDVAHIQKNRKFYEENMQLAFDESRRTVKPFGLCSVVFAHTETEAWEALLSALVNAGWCITASWAIDTERNARMIAQRQSSLASSVHLVCRPRENDDGTLKTDLIGNWRDVIQELPQRIHEWLPRLRDEGVVGADAIFACLGPALEIFSRYSSVETFDGKVIELRQYLEEVWATVSKEALQMIFKDANSVGFEPDARLTAMWLWTLSTSQDEDDLESANLDDLDSIDDENDEEVSSKNKLNGFTLEFDTARKIAQGMGIKLEDLRNTVQIKGKFARLFGVKERSNILFGNINENAAAKTATRKKNPQQNLFAELEETIETGVGGWNFADESRKGETVLDRLHQAMLFFAANRSEALKRFVVDDGVGQDERFWRLANALSALYPTNSEEKRWVDGVLARKKGLGF